MNHQKDLFTPTFLTVKAKTRQKYQEHAALTPDQWPAPTVPPVTWEEAQADFKRGPVVSSPEDVSVYLKKYIGGKSREVFMVLFTDHRNHILEAVCMGQGTIDHTAVYPREIMVKALELNATGCILAHNHPAGSLEPSEGDKALTRQILTGSRALGITVHDHLIVTHEGSFSFRQAGLLV